MAFALTQKVMTLPQEFIPISASTAQMQFPSTTTSTAAGAFAHQEFSDYTTTGMIPLSTQVSVGTVGDFGYGHQQYRALIYLKALTGTTGPMMMAALEAATSTGYSPVYVLDSRPVSGTSTQACLFLFGQFPLVTGAQFARVNFYSASTSAAVSSSTAVDVIIEGA